MIRNLFKVAFRNMWKTRLFTLINIVGLSTGIVCFFLIMVNVVDEFSYDKFEKDGDRLYRVALERIYPENRIFYSIIPPSIGPAIASDFPEVEDMTRLLKVRGNVVFKLGDKTFEESRVLFVEPRFFRMFSIPIVEGNPDAVFSTPNSLVLTRDTARRYFGSEDPMGRELTTPQGAFLVSAVCENLPGNSHLDFDLLAPLALLRQDDRPNYISFAVHTYVLLKPGASTHSVEARLPALVEKYAAGQIQEETGRSYKDYIAAGNGYRYFLQPVRSIHLHSNLENEIKPNGNAGYVYVLIAIAAFLIVIAGINFMNLSTARSTARAREVGIRKIAGTTRGALVRQFLFESLLVSTISLVVAGSLAVLLLPVFNGLARKHLVINYLVHPFQPALLLAVGIGVGLLAGLYPALVLSSFRPVTMLKGRFTTSRSGVRVRNGLVVFQFMISIVCMAMTLIVYRQLDFVRTKDLGFDPARVAVVNRAFSLRARNEAFRDEVSRLPGVASAAGSDTTVSGGGYFGVMFQTEGGPDVKTTRGMTIDENFVNTLGLTVTRGRGFSREFNDSRSVLFNEAAVRQFGWTDPVGMKIRRLGGEDEPTGEYTIVGIVRDLNYNSLHSPINSFIYFCFDRENRVFGNLNVRLKPGNTAATVSAIENVWKSFGTAEPFRYDFMEDRLDALYGNERTSGRIFTVFSLLAVVIACIGLFGLSAYTTGMRTKEIGIRKTLGSSPARIGAMLSGDFAKLVLLAIVIGFPVAYYAMSRWLQNFAFRTAISFWIFLVAGGTALAIQQLTTSYQAFKAARTNPADALRFE